MATAISLDLRRRVPADGQAGYASVAARKSISSAEWGRTFDRRFEQTGAVTARRHATRRQQYHVRHEAALPAAVADQPTAHSPASASTSGWRCAGPR